ncbi:hypothetical protein M758_12G014100 [Ceratodon purpureus]|nr:hypothetical protein M758_12G014100 [Ceratodon purpureus]
MQLIMLGDGTIQNLKREENSLVGRPGQNSCGIQNQTRCRRSPKNGETEAQLTDKIPSQNRTKRSAATRTLSNTLPQERRLPGSRPPATRHNSHSLSAPFNPS